jgi:hypothetical protein
MQHVASTRETRISCILLVGKSGGKILIIIVGYGIMLNGYVCYWAGSDSARNKVRISVNALKSFRVAFSKFAISVGDCLASMNLMFMVPYILVTYMFYSRSN